MFTEYYGMGFDPFNKQNLKEKDAFPSEVHRQMQERLEYLKRVRGSGYSRQDRGWERPMHLGAL